MAFSFLSGFNLGQPQPAQLSGVQLDAIATRLGDVNRALDPSWKQRTFGVEVELTGVTFKQAFQAVQRGLGHTVTGPPSYPYQPMYRSGWDVSDSTGDWSVKSDSSVTASMNGDPIEVVTPPLKIESIGKLTAVLDALCAAGAIANSSTGIHVHVGAGDIQTAEMICLAHSIWKIEPLLLKAIQQHSSRVYYAAALEERRLACMREASSVHEMISCSLERNVGFNLRSFLRLSTVEFRYFNSTLSARTVRAYVQFALALVTHARTRCKVPRAIPAQLRPTVESPAYEMRRFLVGLGMSGPDFADARHVLATGLPGHTTFPTRAAADAHAIRHRGIGARAKWETEWPPAIQPCATARPARPRRAAQPAASRPAADASGPSGTDPDADQRSWARAQHWTITTYVLRDDGTGLYADPLGHRVEVVSAPHPHGGGRYVVTRTDVGDARGFSQYRLYLFYPTGLGYWYILLQNGYFRKVSELADAGWEPQIFASQSMAQAGVLFDRQYRLRKFGRSPSWS